MSTDLNMEYQEVKFGEIAKHISKRVEPSETTLDVYVGLEHLDPDSLKITRHGVPSDVAGQKLLVKKGQIIFGKRRAYQRKVAVADWDCICSAHAMVLEAIPGKILPEFLPFFMQSNQFMERAVEISEGSLSPTIKWKILEQQIFKIPTIDGQKIILEIYQKLDVILNFSFDALNKLKKLLNSWFGNFYEKTTGPIRDLSSCIKNNPQYGAPEKGEEYDDTKYRYIRITDITDLGTLSNDDLKGVSKSISLDYLLKKDDFLFARSGNTVGKTLLYTEDFGECIFAGYLIKVTPNPEVLLPEYLDVFTKSNYYWDWVEATARGGAQPNINAQQIAKLTLKVPNIEEQKIVVGQYKSLFNIGSELSKKIENLIRFKKQII